jgi:hypothetical protein
VSAVGEKPFEPFFDFRNGIRPRHAEGVEAERAGALGECGLDGVRIGQKSRSA